VVHALWSSVPSLTHARQKCTLIFYFGIPFCQGSAAFNIQPTVLSFIVHFRASARPTISRDAKTLKVHKNMQLAICFAFRFSAFQSFSSSRRSCAARRRIVSGMKNATRLSILSLFKLFRLLCSSPFTSNPSLVSILSFSGSSAKSVFSAVKCQKTQS
jgi:hypothetical protein